MPTSTSDLLAILGVTDSDAPHFLEVHQPAHSLFPAFHGTTVSSLPLNPKRDLSINELKALSPATERPDGRDRRLLVSAINPKPENKNPTQPTGRAIVIDLDLQRKLADFIRDHSQRLTQRQQPAVEFGMN